MPSPTRSLYSALDCARTLIEQGETDATAHGGWLGVILSATPQQIAELYEAAGMPAPACSAEPSVGTPAAWMPHANAMPQRVMALLQSRGKCTAADLAALTRAKAVRISVAIKRLRQRGVNIETTIDHMNVCWYRLVS
jgi:hypothetical protein